MEDKIDKVWDMVMLIYKMGAGCMGLCIVGFFYLLKSRDGFEGKINSQIINVVELLTEIKDSLIGTMDKKGLKTIVYEHEKTLKELTK